MALRRSTLLAGIAAVGLAAIGIALVSQHMFDMQPCPWCTLQRLVFAAIAVAALVGLAWRAAVMPVAIALLGAAGAATALWQHFVAAKSVSCNLTLADRILSATQLDAWLPEVFQPRASCAEAAVDLLGVPYEFWSLALFLGLIAAAVGAAARR
jgi:protein dithiol:quinone oxidoreductase